MRQLTICCWVYLHVHGPRGGDKVRPQWQRCRHSVPVVLLILRSGRWRLLHVWSGPSLHCCVLCWKTTAASKHMQDVQGAACSSTRFLDTAMNQVSCAGFRVYNEGRSGLRACIWLPRTPLGWQL